MIMKLEKSCGGIIFRKKEDKIEYLLVKHKKEGGGHWDFPKGHVKEGESEEDTAHREIYEEVGLKVRFLNGFKESIFYIDHINNVRKKVVFFLGEMISSKIKYVSDEVEERTWLNYNDASKRLTYEKAVTLLKKAFSFLEKSKL